MTGWRARSAAVAAACAIACAAGGAWAGPRALLVGVSEYPGLDASTRLEGPKHDVIAMRQTLLERGIPADAMRVLADGVPGAALPTRAAILAALDALATEVQPGDPVALFFAGHGSRQPGPDGGLVEVFLPRDTTRWQPGQRDRTIPNAIADHELRERIDRLGERGAFVWAVFDACHAASLVRGEGDDVVLRRVAPQSLGVPPGTPGASTPPRPAPKAGAVYFYAAQSDEAAQEKRLPAAGSPRRGVFSFAITEALAGGAGMTYRQLSQAVLLRYAALNVGTSTTPVVSGNALDAPVLGRAAPPVRQWLLQRDAAGLALAAGALADLQPGAVLALLPGAASPDAQALGFVRVAEADAVRARLAPIAFGGRREPTAADLQRAAVARLVQPAPAPPLAIAVDLAACASPCPWTGAVTRARSRSARFAWAETNADLRLAAEGRRLWLLPPGSGGVPCARVAQPEACVTRQQRLQPALLAAPGAADDTLADALLQTLDTAARALELLHHASRYAAAPDIGVDTQVTLLKKAGDVAWQPGSLPLLADGDGVRVLVRNTGTRPADVSVLLVDGRYGITPLFPPAGALNRIEPKTEQPLEFKLNNADTAGVERLVIVATRAEPLGERSDLSLLAQPPLPGHRVVRGDGAGQRTQIQVVSWRLP